MSDEHGDYDSRSGLQISYHQPIVKRQISAEVPIVFRESVDEGYSREQDRIASLPGWQRDLTTQTPSTIAQSDERLLAYFNEVSAYEKDARNRDSSPRRPSGPTRSRYMSIEPSSAVQQSGFVPRRPPRHTKTYDAANSGNQVNDRRERHRDQLERAGYRAQSTPSYSAYRKQSAIGKPNGPPPTRQLPYPPGIDSRGRKDSQFLPRNTYVPPPQAPAQKLPTEAVGWYNHGVNTAIAHHHAEPEYSQRQIYGFPVAAGTLAGSSTMTGHLSGSASNNVPVQPHRSPFGDEFEIRYGVPHNRGTQDEQLRLDDAMISPRSTIGTIQPLGATIPDNREPRAVPQTLSETTNYPPKVVNQSDFNRILRSMTTSTAETEGKDKDVITRQGSRKRFAFWRKPWILVLSAIVLLLLIAGAAVGIFFIVRAKNSSLASSGNIPGGFHEQLPAMVNNASAATGTSMAALSFSNSAASSGDGYINFYQHSTGELRMAVFNNSQWHPSQFVTTDAHQGTPITAMSRGNSSQISLFYFDKNKILQEIRGSHEGDAWTNGTIGALGQTSNIPSDLTAQYVGTCQGSGLAWLVFHTGSHDQARLLYWNEDTDKWTASGAFSSVKQGEGFTGQSDGDIWRFYHTSSQTNQITEQVCPDCCNSPQTTGWVAGLNGSHVSSTSGGMAVTNAGLARLVYYQDGDGTIRELNNTNQYPNEIWMTNVTSTTTGGNTGVSASTGSSGPVGMAVAKAMPNSKMSVMTGYQNNMQQIMLFYQANGTDITMQTRNVDSAGRWSRSRTIPVGR